MTIYYMMILSTYLLSLVSRIAKEKKRILISMFYTLLVAFILIIISGLRKSGGDTYFYIHSYNLLVQDRSSMAIDKDIGFSILSLLLTYISSNPQILLFTTSLITHLSNIIIFNKYISYMEVEVFLYITSGYFFTAMNGIRQCLAAALIFLSTRLLIDGKFKLYFISILLISTIHESALIMIPIYFIVRNEAWSRKIIIMILLSVIIVIGYDKVSIILFGVLENTQYGHYSEFNEGGSSLIRTIVNMVPVFLAYIKRKELKEKWNESSIFVNISIINLIFTAMSMNNWIFNRFTLYFQLYNFVLIPYMVKKCFDGKERRLIYIGVIFCYSIFFYREQIIGVGTPYTTDYLKFNKIFYKLK